MHKKQNLKPTINQRFSRWYTRAVVLGATGTIAMADGTAPLDLSSAGSTIAGYVATAAGAGLLVMTAIWGIKIIIKAFKGVAK